MLPSYDDIRSRLGDPVWFDDHGVPRYEPFEPDMLGVYDTYAALLTIGCQGCNREFQVGIGRAVTDAVERAPVDEVADWWPPTLPNDVDGRPWGWSWHYGDPPRHGCIGDTMNSVPVAVVEFWRRDKEGSEGRLMATEWRRDENHEIEWTTQQEVNDDLA